jgi:hypothetical protein
MNYKDQVYEVYTAQLHHQALTCMGDEDDPFPSIAYKAQYTTNTDDTLHVYTRVEHRGSGHGCKLLEAAIKHCIEKNWRVSVSTDIPKIQAVLDESGLNKDCSGYWQRKSNK